METTLMFGWILALICCQGQLGQSMNFICTSWIQKYSKNWKSCVQNKVSKISLQFFAQIYCIDTLLNCGLLRFFNLEYEILARVVNFTR